mgnify:CR=1 FL=1
MVSTSRVRADEEAGRPESRDQVFRQAKTVDRGSSGLVVILNKTLADRLFPNEDPIGRQVAWTGEVLKFIPVSGDWRTVVGVVGDTKDGGLDAPPLPAMFMPFVQEAFPSGGLVIRSRGDAAQLGSDFLIDCDVSDMAALDRAFEALKQRWDSLDFVVHAIGYSDKNELRGKFVDTSLDNFLMTMNISVYSFIAVTQRARAMMKPGGSLLTLTYYGAEKVIPHYNVMGVAKAALEASVKYLAMDLGPEGIRVNGISAGPIKTLAASGIGDFRYIMKWNEYNSPLRRNVTIEDVGGAGLYLCSDLASGVTGGLQRLLTLRDADAALPALGTTRGRTGENGWTGARPGAQPSRCPRVDNSSPRPRPHRTNRGIGYLTCAEGPVPQLPHT